MSSTRQWRPDGFARNCMLPRTLRTAEDFFSHTQWRVIEAMTTKTPVGSDVRSAPDHSWHCTMTYGVIALHARVCPKTARNTIKRASRLGLIRVFETIMQGGLRRNTHYIIEPFKTFLAKIRQDPAYFHTADNHVVGSGRCPEVFTPANGEIWKLNPAAPPPPRSLGPIGPRRSPGGDVRRKPREYTALELETIRAELHKAGTSPINTGDPAKVLAAARQAWQDAGMKDEVRADLVAGVMSAIARSYRANPAYPVPAVGWFVRELPKRIQAWVAQNPPTQRSRTG